MNIVAPSTQPKWHMDSSDMVKMELHMAATAAAAVAAATSATTAPGTGSNENGQWDTWVATGKGETRNNDLSKNLLCYSRMRTRTIYFYEYMCTVGTRTPRTHNNQFTCYQLLSSRARIENYTSVLAHTTHCVTYSLVRRIQQHWLNKNVH